MFAFFSGLDSKRLLMPFVLVFHFRLRTSLGIFIHCDFSRLSTTLSVDKVVILDCWRHSHSQCWAKCVVAPGCRRPAHAGSESFILVTSSLQWGPALTNHRLHVRLWQRPSRAGNILEKKKNTVSLTFITARFMFRRMRVNSEQIRRSLADSFKMPTRFSSSICRLGCHSMFYFWGGG